MIAAGKEAERRTPGAALDALAWLGLAAARTFTVMARLIYVSGTDRT